MTEETGKANNAIEIRRWQTPIEGKGPYICGLEYGDGGHAYIGNGKRFEDIPPDRAMDAKALAIKIYCTESKELYRVLFAHADGFRVLDEGGFTEIWDAAAKHQSRDWSNSLRLRGHGWAREAMPIIMDDWTWMIATNGICVEVIADQPPSFIKLVDHRGAGFRHA